MSYNYLPIDKSPTSFEQIKNLLAYDQLVSITFDAHSRITTCWNFIHEKNGNTQMEELQQHLILSHACELDQEVPKEIVKLMIMLKIKSFSYGYSGVQIDTVKRLVEMYNEEILPVIFTQRSLGESSDFALLSQLSWSLIGLGEVYHRGIKMPALQALNKLGWQPIQLQSMDGQALRNGSQIMSAYGLHNLIQAERLLQWADIISAISLDAFDCMAAPLLEKIHPIRAHKGQEATAAKLRELLKDSAIAHQKKEHIQNPNSFRCIPQVHGAVKDNFDYVLSVFIQEINSVTANTTIFPEEDLIVKGGDFHGDPLALVLNFLSLSMGELANISESRTYLLIAKYTAGGFVSDNNQLGTPESADLISSSISQESEGSKGVNAATKCIQVMDRVEKVLAIELLTAVQALEFGRPMQSSPQLESIVQALRKEVSCKEAGVILQEDIVKAIKFIRTAL